MPRKVPLARRRLCHVVHVRYHFEEFLEVVVQDDSKHHQSEAGCRGEHFLDDLIVAVKLVKDESDSFGGYRAIDRQEYE